MPAQPSPDGVPSARCQRCGTGIGAAAFVVSGAVRCGRCALLHGPMLRRSFYTALVVGTFLTAINQGNILAHGDFPPALFWKIPLTYCVPFAVATWGALGNAHLPRHGLRRAGDEPIAAADHS